MTQLRGAWHSEEPTDYAVLDAKLWSNWGDMFMGKIDHQRSLSVDYGLSYNPNSNTDFLLLSYRWIYSYEDVWVHKAPESLNFVWEVAAGGRIKDEPRAVLSCGMFAMYYLDFLQTEVFRPYVDAGIGIIYTDFQVEDQGLRVNFNPRASIGTEIKLSPDGPPWFVALRMFHLSNGGLHRDNQGINAAMIMIGRYF